ncbi:hypothetical protein B0H15DRAFT_988802 [Mycena belliarum]|uniref:Uncharacterized protein n=1 Tax=Mycena belliarum TaxID=1033014 RepID=A0AAD6U584_9AGAR|nr:hypothetical protein B0H15DRAFT_988802 [Mycena belliae]
MAAQEHLRHIGCAGFILDPGVSGVPFPSPSSSQQARSSQHKQRCSQPAPELSDVRHNLLPFDDGAWTSDPASGILAAGRHVPLRLSPTLMNVDAPTPPHLSDVHCDIGALPPVSRASRPTCSDTTDRVPASGLKLRLRDDISPSRERGSNSSLNFFSFRRFAPALTITLGHLGRLADSIFRRPANGVQPILFVHRYCCPRASRPNALTRYMGVRRGGFQLLMCARSASHERAVMFFKRAAGAFFSASHACFAPEKTRFLSVRRVDSRHGPSRWLA